MLEVANVFDGRLLMRSPMFGGAGAASQAQMQDRMQTMRRITAMLLM